MDAVRQQAAQDAAARRAEFEGEIGRLQAEPDSGQTSTSTLPPSDEPLAQLQQHPGTRSRARRGPSRGRRGGTRAPRAARDAGQRVGAGAGGVRRASDSVVRAAAQDDRIAFLNRRLSELERLTEAMQGALLAQAGGAPAAAAQEISGGTTQQQQRSWCGGVLTAHTASNPAALQAPLPAPATARFKGTVESVARVKLAATAGITGPGVVETQYYAVVA